MHLFILISSGFLSVISGLISRPMMKPDGSVDIASVLSHVTLLEQTVTSFQTKTNQLETEMQSTKTELQVTKAKLEIALADLKNHQQGSSADVTSLKDELAAVKGELGLMTNEVISVKTEVANLKKESAKNHVNFTVIDHDVSSNLENLKHLQTELLSVKRNQDKTNTSIQSFLTTMLDVNKTTADIQQKQTEMKTEMSKLSSLQSNISSDIGDVKNIKDNIMKVQSNISSAVHDVNHIKDNVMTVQSQLITTKDEIILIKTNMATLRNESRILTNDQRIIETEILNISSALKQSNEASTAGSVSHIKEDIRAVQSQLNTTTGDISQVRSGVTTLTRNISTLQMMLHGNSQSLTQLSQTLALKTKDVSFHVYLASSITISTNLPMTFNAVHHNAGNGYNTTTGKFTAPVSGTYIFSAEVEMYGSKQRGYVHIVQSGSAVSSGYGKTSTDDDDISVPVTAITPVRQGEQVWVILDSDVQLYGGDNLGYPSYFVGVLMSAD